MKYTVTWLKSAQDHLAQLWLDAVSRQEITDAANAIDFQLRRDPYQIVKRVIATNASFFGNLWASFLRSVILTVW